MKEDVNRLLKGPNPTYPNFYILCALSDLNSLLSKASSPVHESNGNFAKKYPNEHFPSIQLESPTKIKNHTKKIEYFLSYVKDHYKYM